MMASSFGNSLLTHKGAVIQITTMPPDRGPGPGTDWRTFEKVPEEKLMVGLEF
jgi:hypothetical protein